MRAVLLGTVVCLAAVDAAAAASGADIRVQLRNDAVVSGPTVVLGDVARIRGADERAREALRAVELGAAPRPRYSGHLTRRDVAARLETGVDGDRYSVQWSGPSVVRVERESTAIDPERYVEAAREVLVRWLEARYDDVRVQSIGFDTEPLVPLGRLRLNARMGSEARVARRMQVWVDTWVDGTRYRSTPVRFSVHAWAPALVATRDLEPGLVLRSEDTRTERVDWARHAGRLMSSVDGRALRVKRPLRRGSPLTDATLELLPAVARDTEVAVAVSVGRVSISASGIAVDDGDIGDIVHVRPHADGGAYRARVLARGRVRVEGDFNE